MTREVRSKLERLSRRSLRRIAVAVIGATLLVFGAVLLVVPGPGLLVLALGLAILGAEFAWARRLLRRVESATTSTLDRVRSRTPEDGERDRDESAHRGDRQA